MPSMSKMYREEEQTFLTAFRSEKALASWGGLCPGNNESAGKRKSGRSPVRKHPFKELMIEIAWAAVRTIRNELKPYIEVDT